MNIISPHSRHIPQLRCLWKEAFGDTEEFLDKFFDTAFSPDRCFCITLDNTIAATLYWFRCEYLGKPVAYIYAVATAKKYQGHGLCHKLMAHTHAHLETLGYNGAILVPGNQGLFDFYDNMGYKTSCFHRKTEYLVSEDSLLSQGDLLSQDLSSSRSDFSPTPVSKEKYTALRRGFLPEGSVIQERENLDFLETQCTFYEGKNFIFAAHIKKSVDGTCALNVIEFLGNTAVMPEILPALGCKKGVFLTPVSSNVSDCIHWFCSPENTGNIIPFAMYKPLGGSSLIAPTYFGFAFD